VTSSHAFAGSWIAAWNSHDLDRILAHYEDDVVLISPRVRLVTGSPLAILRGRSALRDYFGEALKQFPDLSFVLERVYAGEESIVIQFLASYGRIGAEFMMLGPTGLVREVRAHYAPVGDAQ
jgi:hypothetical protein